MVDVVVERTVKENIARILWLPMTIVAVCVGSLGFVLLVQGVLKNELLILGWILATASAWVLAVCFRAQLASVPSVLAKRLPSVQENIEASLDLLIEQAISKVQKYSDLAYSNFVEICLSPVNARQRVVETLEFNTPSSKKTVSTTLVSQYVAVGTGRHIIPIIDARKGRLYDNFSLTSRDDLSMRTLSYSDGTLVVAAAVVILFRQAYEVPESIEDWTWQQIGALRMFMRLLVCTLPPKDKDGTRPDLKEWADGELSQTVSDLEGPASRYRRHLIIADEKAREQLYAIVHRSIDRYLVVGECAAGTTYRFTYSYDITTSTMFHRTAARGRRRRAVVQWLSHRFKVPCGYIQFGLTRAMRSQSYHLYLKCPPGSFLGTVDVVDEEEQVIVMPRSESTLTSWYFRKPLVGTNFGHFYSRRLASIDRSCTLRLRIFEVPQGMQLVGTLFSMLTAPIVLILGHLATHAKGLDLPPSDLITATLTVPAALTGVLAAVIAVARRTFAVSLTAIAIALVSSGILLLSMGIYLLQFSAEQEGRQANPLEWIWLPLQTVSLIVGCFSLSVLVLRGRRYWQLMK